MRGRLQAKICKFLKYISTFEMNLRLSYMLLAGTKRRMYGFSPDPNSVTARTARDEGLQEEFQRDVCTVHSRFCTGNTFHGRWNGNMRSNFSFISSILNFLRWRI